MGTNQRGRRAGTVLGLAAAMKRASDEGRSMVIRGNTQAVARNETVATISVRRSRLSRATGPPRHSQSTRTWVP